MLTPSQLAVAQADAIARLARIRAHASVDLRENGQLVLELHGRPDTARTFIQDTLGHLSRNIALVLLWEKRHTTLA